MIFDRLLELIHSAGHLSPHGAGEGLEEPAKNYEMVSGVSDSALGAVGRESEALRRNHVDILGNLRALASMEDEITETFRRAETLFDELAQSKAEVARIEAVARVEREAHEAAMQRNSDLSQQYERTRSELDAALAQSQRLAGSLQKAEAEGKGLEQSKADLTERLTRAESAHAAAQEAGRLAELDLVVLRADLEASDLRLAQTHAELAKALQDHEIAQERAGVIERQLEETRAQAAQWASELAREKDALSSSRQRERALDGELAAAHEELARHRAAAQNEIAAAREQIAALSGKLTHAEAIEAVRERMLQDMQAERANWDERRTAAERSARESELAARQATELRSAAEDAKARAESALADARASQKRMLRRVTPLIGALRERTQEAAARAATIAQLEARLEARAREMNEAIQAADAVASALTAELEDERSRRLVAEAALREDRERRVATVDDGANGPFGGSAVDAKGMPLLSRPRPDRRRARVKPAVSPFHAA